MKTLTGVVNLGLQRTVSKQDALLLERIAVRDLDYHIAHLIEDKELLAELDWLRQQQIIFSATIRKDAYENNKELQELYLAMLHNTFLTCWLRDPSMSRDDMKKVIMATRALGANDLSDQTLSQFDLEEMEHTVKRTRPKERKRLADELVRRGLESDLRATALFLEDYYQNTTAVPILPASTRDTSSLPNSGTDSVARIVINALPRPDDSTPWDRILDFRRDPDAVARFREIRHWIAKVSREKTELRVIEEELEYLIHQYEEHMRFHKIKINASVFETLVTSAAGILEDFMKFKWKDATKHLFLLKHRKIALMEEERKAPGREIAYIVMARERFRM